MVKELSEETLVVVPAYNAQNTILKVINEIIESGFKNILISDDFSNTSIQPIVGKLDDKIIFIEQKENLGYGGNQKFLYNYALRNNFKYVVMIHGDLQYTPTLIPPLVTMLKFAKYDFVFGSRILGGNATKNGMPIIKFIANRSLTLFQNMMTGYKLSEYHSGLRAYNSEILKSINFNEFSNKFLFDNQMLLALIKKKYKIGEVSCITKYDTNSSSISYKESTIYAIGVIKLTFKHFFRNIL
ncbi:glycosyltransferase family 2 protein [Aequorivita antarctica]|uniref:Glycosyltransferase family 2 protein n=1 Tax=Aequorivita antarctica TaxID=153266 RepID=A0A5C6Z1J6_9FLAO|nr:glycosyltransferase family 2 protein [Aequorivita antarctica]TXD73914.1 glycosyltransferase family 2 protein [Aequorivita antarctica]SRX73367.1 Polyprenol monophosphomannose synthase [Aequorivita antarctica]